MLHRVTRALGAMFLFASAGLASQVDLTGDLGANSWTGTSFSPINTSTTTNFLHAVPGFGLIVGDVFANNTSGASFALRVTNLTFVITAPLGPSAPFTDVMLVAKHNYQTAGPGAYSSSHQLTGQWSALAGNAVSLDTVLDLTGTPLTLNTLSGINTGLTTSFNFGNPGLASTTTSPIFTIQTTLRLRIEANGTIVLPSSADVDVEFVPGAGTVAPLAMTGLIATRRRR